MDIFNEIFLLHLFATFAMTGVIWLVHLLTYPTMRLIPSEVYAQYHQFHTARIGFVVVPLMLLEMATAFLLCLFEQTRMIFIANLILLILIWMNTFLHSVPAHNKLVHSKDPKALDNLINLNIIRTVLWTLRSMVFLGALIYGIISF